MTRNFYQIYLNRNIIYQIRNAPLFTKQTCLSRLQQLYYNFTKVYKGLYSAHFRKKFPLSTLRRFCYYLRAFVDRTYAVLKVHIVWIKIWLNIWNLKFPAFGFISAVNKNKNKVFKREMKVLKRQIISFFCESWHSEKVD